MLKRIKKKICLYITCITFTFTSAAAPAMNVNAASVGILWGIVEIASTLLFSAGVTYLGYQSIKNLSKDDDEYLTLMDSILADEDISAMINEMNDIDGTSALDTLSDGESINGTNFKVIKGGGNSDNNNSGNLGNGLNLAINGSVISKAADIIKDFIESDSNQYESSYEVDYSAYVSNNYSFTNYEYDDLMDMFGSVVYDAILDTGYDESNSTVIRYQYTYNNIAYNTFFVLPYNMSFIAYYYHEYGYSTSVCGARAFTMIPTDKLLNLFNGIGITSNEIYLYLDNNEEDLITVTYNFATNSIVDIPENSQVYNAINDCITNAYAYSQYNLSEYQTFGYKEESNSHLWRHCTGKDVWGNNKPGIDTFFPSSTENYITPFNSNINLNVADDEYIYIPFDASTVDTLASTNDVGQTHEMIVSLSPDLSALYEQLEDNQAQDNENAAEIVGSIEGLGNTFTNGLNGLGDKLLNGIKDLFVPDMDAVKIKFNEVFARIQDEFAILFIPYNIAASFFSVFDTSGDIPDFILVIPEMAWMDVKFYDGYSFNMNQFLEESEFHVVAELFKFITDVIIVILLIGYSQRKFDSIFGGGK